MLDPNSKPLQLHRPQNPPCCFMIQTYRFHYTPLHSLFHFLPSFPKVSALLPTPALIFPPPSPWPVKASIGHTRYGTGVFEVNKTPVCVAPKAYSGVLPMLMPKPAGNSSNNEAAIVKSSSLNNYDFSEIEGKTTLMIKNIPNQLSKKMLLHYLDKHCIEENQKLKNQQHPSPPASEYDFVYLPMDFRTGINLGYAFVNFTSVAGAVRFYWSYHKLKWGLKFRNSGKVCEIKHARIQGLEALVEHFATSCLRYPREDYRPTVFSPPRTGDPQASIVVGRGEDVSF